MRGRTQTTSPGNDIPGLPRKAGPPEVKNNTGYDVIIARDPDYQVQMSGGVFVLIWELVEARGRDHYHRYKDTMPYIAEAYVEAVKEFRAAYHAVHGVPEFEEKDDVILDDDDEEVLTDDDWEAMADQHSGLIDDDDPVLGEDDDDIAWEED